MWWMLCGRSSDRQMRSMRRGMGHRIANWLAGKQHYVLGPADARTHACTKREMIEMVGHNQTDHWYGDPNHPSSLSSVAAAAAVTSLACAFIHLWMTQLREWMDKTNVNWCVLTWTVPPDLCWPFCWRVAKTTANCARRLAVRCVRLLLCTTDRQTDAGNTCWAVNYDYY